MTTLAQAAQALLDELAHHANDALVREKMAEVRKALASTPVTPNKEHSS